MEMLNPFQANISEFLSKRDDTSDNLLKSHHLEVSIHFDTIKSATGRQGLTK